MKIKQLRGILNRYGAAGVLFVGGYLVVHHALLRRRKTCIAAAIMLSVLSMWLLLHPHHVPDIRKPSPVVPLTPPASPPPAPVPARLHLSLQDDTQPGPPLPPALPDNSVGNGWLVFDATYYHKSGQFYKYEYSGEEEETLDGDETSHIYRIRADGSQLRQLTWGDDSDYAPVLSPDGQCIAFLRGDYEHRRLYWVSIHGGRVHALSSSQCDYSYHLSWSADGKWLALIPESWEGDDLFLVSPTGSKQIRLPNIKEAIWSPDGRLYMRDNQDHARIVRPGSSSVVTVRDVVCRAVWLDNHTLAGDKADEEKANYTGSITLHVINDRGVEMWQKEVRVDGEQNEYSYDHHSWHRVPQHPNTLILQNWQHTSGGADYRCFRVDTRTGTACLLGYDSLVGVAPDGSQIAVAEHEWVGPYKRGGARVGPLKFVTLASGHSHAVTGPLACITEGDWQAAHPVPPSSLLYAVECNNIPHVRLLLTQGVSANVHLANGTTALMIAAGEGNVAMVRLLLRFHADPNRINNSGETALMEAVGAQRVTDEVATERQIAIAQLLVQAGAHLNARSNEGKTALIMAASGGRARVVDWLLRHGTQVDTRDKDGQTALICAASSRYAHTLQVLLDHNAAVNLRNKEKQTALAIIQEHSAEHDSPAFLLLKQAGAKE